MGIELLHVDKETGGHTKGWTDMTKISNLFILAIPFSIRLNDTRINKANISLSSDELNKEGQRRNRIDL